MKSDDSALSGLFRASRGPERVSRGCWGGAAAISVGRANNVERGRKKQAT